MAGGDELASLADTINRMLEALSNSQVERNETEDRYRLMAENSTDMITRHNPEGIFIYVSPASRALLGYEPSELVGARPQRLFSPRRFRNHRQSSLESPGAASYLHCQLPHPPQRWPIHLV